MNNVWKNSQRQWDRNFFAQGSYKKAFGERYALLVNAKYARDYMRYLNPDTTLMYINNSFWQDDIYVSVANKFSISRNWDVDLSADYQWNALDATLSSFAYPVRHTALVALASAYQWRGLKAQASVLGSFVTDRATLRNTNGERSRQVSHLSKFTPAVFLSYQPWSSRPLSLRAFYKRIFRMPTFNDLYYTDFGNASLKPEYATQYDLGAVYDFADGDGVLSTLSVSVDGYYNTINNKIIAVPKGTGQYRWMMMNIGRVKVRGVDVSTRIGLALPHGVALLGGLNYTYQRAQDYSDPTDCRDEAGTYKGQIAYIPWHSGSATLGGRWRGAELNYSFIYVGERYHNSSNILANYEQPWYTHDLSASYNFRWCRVDMRLTAEVNNLLNQQYDVIRNYPMPGRNYKLILKIDL